MKINRNFFSNLAFNLAQNHLGKTKSNPSVGCLIVKNNTVISSGVTSISGRPHAEQNALKRNLSFKGSDMYVTLEPCTHYGLTPPCTNLINKKKINRVFYSFNDPDLRTFKKAKKKLKNRIIKLKKIESKNKNFYDSYFINKKTKQPYLSAKIAISHDYFTINKRSQWITNSRSRNVGHLIRSNYDTIISTSRTINKDNSLLNCRINGLNNLKPDLIIIDRNLKLKKNLKLFHISKNRNTYIVTLSKDKKKINYFLNKKIKIIKVNSLENKNDFTNLLKKIFKLGKRRILIESGLTFLNKLIKFKMINKLYIFKSSLKLKKNGINNTDISYIKKLKLRNKQNVNLEDDNLFKIGIR